MVIQVGEKQVEFHQNIWTGKKSISVNGTPCQKLSKKEFIYNENGTAKTIQVKGNDFSGISLCMEGGEFRVTEPVKWYEYILAFTMFIIVMVMGNSPKIAEHFVVVGGAIGGGIAGGGAVLTLYLLKSVKNVWLKILIALGLTVGVVFICHIVALQILVLFA